MGKGLKIVGSIIAIFVVILGAAIILAKVYITPERVRDAVLPLAKDALKREVQLGNIEVSLFSGIVIDKLVIEERGGGEPFVKADKVLLRYLFWPLLAKEVVIDEVRIDAPRIQIIRNQDGTFNFSDLITKPAGVTTTAPDTTSKQKAAPGAPGGINLLVSKVALTEGAIIFIDRSVSKNEPVSTRLDECNITAENISLEKSFPLMLKAKINGAPVDFRGEADPKTAAVKMAAKIDNLDVAKFAPYFINSIPGKLSSAKLGTNLVLTVAAKTFSTKGEVTLSDVDLSLDAMKDTPFTKATLTLVHDLRFDLGAELLEITSAEIRLSGLPPVQVAGKFLKIKTAPEAIIALTVNEFDLGQTLTSLPGKLGDPVRTFAPKGKLSAKAQLSGPFKEGARIVQGAEVRLSAVEVTVAGIRPVLDGKFTLKEEVLATDAITVRLGESTLKLTGKMEHLFTKPFNPVLDAVITATKLDLAKLTDAVPEKAKAGLAAFNPKGEADVDIKLAGPLNDPLKALSAGEIALRSVEVTAGGMRPTVNGVVVIKDHTVNTKGLMVKAGEDTASIDLTAHNLGGKPIQVTHTLNAPRFNIDALLQKSPDERKDAVGQPQTGEQKEKTTATSGEEPGPLDLPVTVDGTVQIGQALYKGLAIDNLHLHYRLTNNVITVDRMDGQVAGGGFNNKAKVDLGKKGYGYSGDIAVRKMQAEQFVNTFLPKMQGTVFGTLDLDMTLGGAGVDSRRMKENLTGKGEANITDGKLAGGGLTQGLADFLHVEELRVLRFSKLHGTFNIAGGKVNFVSDVSGSDVRMAPQGEINLLDNSIDMALDARLSPPISAKLGGAKIGQFLNDEKGWAQLPLKVAGPLSSPRFAMDATMVTEKLKEKAGVIIQQKLQKGILDKILPGGQQQGATPAAPPTPEQKEPVKDVQDMLKGLLGR